MHFSCAWKNVNKKHEKYIRKMPRFSYFSSICLPVSFFLSLCFLACHPPIHRFDVGVGLEREKREHRRMWKGNDPKGPCYKPLPVFSEWCKLRVEDLHNRMRTQRGRYFFLFVFSFFYDTHEVYRTPIYDTCKEEGGGWIRTIIAYDACHFRMIFWCIYSTHNSKNKYMMSKRVTDAMSGLMALWGKQQMKNL